MKKVITLLICMVSATVSAETVYVVDRVTVGLYTGIGGQGPIVKNVVSGDVLEVLELSGNDMRVKLDDGAEGWIDAKYVMSRRPAQVLLDRTQRTLQKVRSELVEVKQKLAEAQTALTGEKQKTSALAARITQPGPLNRSEGSSANSAGANKFQFNVVWAGISFAMLIAGVIVGMLWVREIYRRKTGGMHIKISGM